MYGGLILTFILHNILLFYFLRSGIDRRIPQKLDSRRNYRLYSICL